MSPKPADPREGRVLVWAPTGKDGALMREILSRDGIPATLCADGEAFRREAVAGAGMAIVADEALAVPRALDALAQVLRSQPAWSELPIVVFTREGHRFDTLLATLPPLANVTTLERPARIPTLVSLVHTALRARRRQYEVRTLLESLADADRRKDEFLAMLGHELRNPLSAIRIAVTLLEHMSDERHGRHLAVIDRQASSLTRIVEDLLDVTRITRGKIVLRRERVDLNDIVRRARQTCESRIREKVQRVELALAPEPVVVDGDPVRLEQIVSNLLHNATKYTPARGHIRIAVVSEGAEAVVAVQDDGIGLPAESIARIFEVFTQLDVSIERSQGGLGLGLPVVKGLVELHGGSVLAESPGPGRGATFSVRLPICASAPAARGERVPSSESGRLARTGAGRVLLVEDNADLREGLDELLREWGFEVVLAADGFEGVRKAIESRPDVALVDLGLPRLDGYEVARRLRAQGSQVRLIAVSGYGQPQDRQRALEAGFDRHLVKPVDLDELLAELSAGVRVSG